MKISILLITYNHSKYISEAVDSLLMQQTIFSKEIVVLDDASVDNTFEIAVDKLSHIQNCRFVKNETNLGITRNYQKGFSLCKGEFVFVLEGDDYWVDADKLSNELRIID